MDYGLGLLSGVFIVYLGQRIAIISDKPFEDVTGEEVLLCILFIFVIALTLFLYSKHI